MISRVKLITISSGLVALAAAILLFSLFQPREKPVEGDLDGDGRIETMVLKGGSLSVTREGDLVWSSPKDWVVASLAVGDSNNDRLEEINLSVWKVGSFGKSKPFWQIGEDVSAKNHLFVLRLERDGMRNVWQSSDLSHPICGLGIKDVDQDGKNDVVVQEGDYAGYASCSPKRQTVWEWKLWNFFRK